MRANIVRCVEIPLLAYLACCFVLAGTGAALAGETTVVGGVIDLSSRTDYADDYHRSSLRVDGDEDGKKWKRDVYEYTSGIRWTPSAYGAMTQTGSSDARIDHFTYKVVRAAGIPNLNIKIGVYLFDAQSISLSVSKDASDWTELDKHIILKDPHELRARLPKTLWNVPKVFVRLSVLGRARSSQAKNETCLVYGVLIELTDQKTHPDGASFGFEGGMEGLTVDAPKGTSAQMDADEARSGSHSLKLTATSDHDAAVRMAIPRDPMGKDSAYALTYWFKGDGAGVPRVELYENKRRIHYRYWGDFRLGVLQPAPDNWTGVRRYLTFGGGKHLTRTRNSSTPLDVVVASRAGGGGTVWFDDVSLVPLSKVTKDSLPPRHTLPAPSQAEIVARANEIIPTRVIDALYCFTRDNEDAASRHHSWGLFGWDKYAEMLSLASYREFYSDRLTQEGRLGATLDRVKGGRIIPDHNLYMNRIPMVELDYHPEYRQMLASRSKDDNTLLRYCHAHVLWYMPIYESPMFIEYKKKEIRDCINAGALMFEVEPYGAFEHQMLGYHPLTEKAYNTWRRQHGLPEKKDLLAFPDDDTRPYMLFCMDRMTKLYRELSHYAKSIAPQIVMISPHGGIRSRDPYLMYHLRDSCDVMFAETQFQGIPKKDWALNWHNTHRHKRREYLPPVFEMISVCKALLGASGGKPAITATYGNYANLQGPNIELHIAELLSQKCSIDMSTPIQRMHSPETKSGGLKPVPVDLEQEEILWTRIGDYFRFRKSHPKLYGSSASKVAIVVSPASWLATKPGEEIHAIAVLGWCQAMMRNHIPFDCIMTYDIPAIASQYSVMILPTTPYVSDKELAILSEYKDQITFAGAEYATLNEVGLPHNRDDKKTVDFPTRAVDTGYEYYHYLNDWRKDRSEELEAAAVADIPQDARPLSIEEKDLFAELNRTEKGLSIHLVDYALSGRTQQIQIQTDRKPTEVLCYWPTGDSSSLDVSWSKGVLSTTIPSLQTYTVVTIGF